jgi:2'-5' RNA ligase
MTVFQRLFIAIAMPVAVRQILGHIQMPAAGFKPVPPANFHLTLKFIGDVPAPLSSTIATALSSIRFCEFDLSIRGVGQFPCRGEPKVFWAGLADCPESLAQLQCTLETTLASIGIERDQRPYRPHITLARCRRVTPITMQELVDRYSGLTTPSFAVREFSLYRSESTPKGPVYTREASFTAEQ